MRHLRFQTIFLSLISFSDLASTLPNNIVARQICESEWCLPSLPWDPIDALMGAGAAVVGDLINGFVKPKSPIGTNEKDSDARTWTNTDIDLGVNPQVEDNQDQCRTSNDLPGWVSFYFAGGIHQKPRALLITYIQGTSAYSKMQEDHKANCLAGPLRVDRRNDSYRGITKEYGP